MTTDMHGTIEELLKVVFCMRPVPRLYIEATSQIIVSHSQGVASGGLVMRKLPVSKSVSMETEHCWDPLPGNDW
jgi:hypothetical protein